MAKERKLTTKEAIFVYLIVAGESDYNAYMASYKSKGSERTARKEAQKVKQRPIVEAAIEKARAEVTEAAQITAQDLIAELEEAREMAKKDREPSAMVRATMGKARITGLDRVIVELQASEELTAWSSVKAGVDHKNAT